MDSLTKLERNNNMFSCNILFVSNFLNLDSCGSLRTFEFWGLMLFNKTDLVNFRDGV